MTEFRAGDRVRVSNSGSVGVVTEVARYPKVENGPLFVYVNLEQHPGDHDLGFLPTSLELIEPVKEVLQLQEPEEDPRDDQKDQTPRGEVLDKAKHLITGDRNNSYGEPTQDFQRSADAATGLGYGKKDHEGNWVGLEAHDVAILVMLIKTSRLQWSPGKEDHWLDIAGYAGCGYECAVKEGHDE